MGLPRRTQQPYYLVLMRRLWRSWATIALGLVVMASNAQVIDTVLLTEVGRYRHPYVSFPDSFSAPTFSSRLDRLGRPYLYMACNDSGLINLDTTATGVGGGGRGGVSRTARSRGCRAASGDDGRAGEQRDRRTPDPCRSCDHGSPSSRSSRLDQPMGTTVGVGRLHVCRGADSSRRSILEDQRERRSLCRFAGVLVNRSGVRHQNG